MIYKLLIAFFSFCALARGDNLPNAPEKQILGLHMPIELQHIMLDYLDAKSKSQVLKLSAEIRKRFQEFLQKEIDESVEYKKYRLAKTFRTDLVRSDKLDYIYRSIDIEHMSEERLLELLKKFSLLIETSSTVLNVRPGLLLNFKYLLDEEKTLWVTPVVFDGDDGRMFWVGEKDLPEGDLVERFNPSGRPLRAPETYEDKTIMMNHWGDVDLGLTLSDDGRPTHIGFVVYPKTSGDSYRYWNKFPIRRGIRRAEGKEDGSLSEKEIKQLEVFLKSWYRCWHAFDRDKEKINE